MGILLQDLRSGFRLMARRPGVTVAVVLVLALGIGLTTAMFSILKGVVLRGLPVENGDRLASVRTHLAARSGRGLNVSVHDYLDWRARHETFEDLAAFKPRTVNLSGGARPERYEGCFITPNGFRLLAVDPILGRLFDEADAVPGAPEVILLGHHVWQRRFSGDSRIVGRTVRVDGSPHMVVGVLPEGFRFPMQADVWLPLELSAAAAAPRDQGLRLFVFGLLRSGISFERSQAEMNSIAARLAQEYPDTNEGVRVTVQPYAHEFIGARVRALVTTMFGAVCAVLVIACANVASLLLAHSVARRREFAVLAAVGASRVGLLRRVLIENLLLTLTAAILGLLVASWGIRLFNGMAAGANWPYWIDIRIDFGVTLFVFGAALVCTLLCGILPASRASRTDPNQELKQNTGGSSGRLHPGWSTAILVTEIALTYALLIAGGLMARTLFNLARIDLGLGEEKIFTARIGLPESTYSDPVRRAVFVERLVRDLESAPGVLRIAATTRLPATSDARKPYRLADSVRPPGEEDGSTYIGMVTPGYFATFGSAVLRGRNFDWQDGPEGEPVAIVNQSFAARVWPDEDPLGQRIRAGGAPGEAPLRTVVGVVPDLGMGKLDEREADGIYLPFSQQNDSFLSLAVRAENRPLTLTSLVRERVERLDPDLPIYWVKTMDQVVDESMFVPRLIGVLFTSFGAVSLFLTLLGIYGVMTFLVRRRNAEIGLRMALGAERRHMFALILRHALQRVIWGLWLGLLLAAGLARLLAGVLYGVSPRDPLTFATIALGILAVALAACFAPARRATQVDPMVALRA